MEPIHLVPLSGAAIIFATSPPVLTAAQKLENEPELT